MTYFSKITSPSTKDKILPKVSYLSMILLQLSFLDKLPFNVLIRSVSSNCISVTFYINTVII